MIRKIFTLWVFKKKTRTQYPQKSLANLLYTWTEPLQDIHQQNIIFEKNRYFTHKWLACTKTITWIKAVFFSGQSLTPREGNRSNGKNICKHKEINYRTTHFFSCFQSILFSYDIKKLMKEIGTNLLACLPIFDVLITYACSEYEVPKKRAISEEL